MESDHPGEPRGPPTRIPFQPSLRAGPFLIHNQPTEENRNAYSTRIPAASPAGPHAPGRARGLHRAGQLRP